MAQKALVIFLVLIFNLNSYSQGGEHEELFRMYDDFSESLFLDTVTLARLVHIGDSLLAQNPEDTTTHRYLASIYYNHGVNLQRSSLDLATEKQWRMEARALYYFELSKKHVEFLTDKKE